MLFVRPHLTKTIHPTTPIWKLVVRKDPRTGKMQVYSQRYYVAPEEAKAPQYREVTEAEVESHKTLLEHIGKSASAFMDSLDERWQGAEGDSELRELVRHEVFARRKGEGGFELSPELISLCRYCKDGDREAGERVLQLALKTDITKAENLRRWFEEAVKIKHERIKELIGAGEAGWVAIPVPPLPSEAETGGRDVHFIRSESFDPRSRETKEFEKFWHDALASAFSKTLMRYLFQPLLAKARDATLKEPAVASFLSERGKEAPPYIWLEPLPMPDDHLRLGLYESLQNPDRFEGIKELLPFVAVPDLIDGIPRSVVDPLSKKEVPYEAVLERWLKTAIKETTRTVKLSMLVERLFTAPIFGLLEIMGTLGGGRRYDLIQRYCTRLEAEGNVRWAHRELTEDEERRVKEAFDTLAERERWKEKIPQLVSDDELFRAVKEFAVIMCNALRKGECPEPATPTATLAGGMLSASHDFSGWELRRLTFILTGLIEGMTVYLRELAGRLGYNLDTEEGRKGFSELLSRIAKVKTDACGVYDVPPPLAVLKSTITYYQVLPALAYGLHKTASFYQKFYEQGEKVSPPDLEKLGVVLKQDEIDSALGKWAEAAPGTVTQMHKEAFSRYRQKAKEAPPPTTPPELLKVPDVVVMATTPSAFFGLGDDNSCFAPGRQNFHHKYYLALVDNSFVMYLLDGRSGGRRGRMWGRVIEGGDGLTFYITNIYGKVPRPDAQRAAKQALEALFPHWEVSEPAPAETATTMSYFPLVYVNKDSFCVKVRPRAGQSSGTTK